MRIVVMMVCLATAFLSCKKEDEKPKLTINDPANAVDTIGQNSFVSYTHNLSGKAIVYKNASGNMFVRLEQFNMNAGPDVYVYLSKTATYNGNVLQVTKLTTGYENSNVNFPFSNSSYSSEYKYALVYCVQFSELFGYAELK